MDRLINLSATKLIELIDKGEVTSRQVTQHFIDRIEQQNPAINAVVITLFEPALKDADHADELFKLGKRTGKFHGLPISIKECLDLKGTPSTMGVMRRKNDIRQNTDDYIAALQREGAIILGKTNVAQLLMYIESCNPVYGVTKNPFNPTYTCGGSSGGEGAVISYGGSPIGIGTDIGGSVRFPAAFCGICSIKPTMQRIPDLCRFIDNQPTISINSVTGILANHAEDLQLMLDVINEEASKKNVNQPLRDFKAVDITKLKVGFFLTDGLFEPMPAIKRAVLEAVDQLKKVGVQVTEFTPPNLAVAEELFFKILGADEAILFTQNLQKEKPMPQVAGLIMLSKAPSFVRSILSGLAGLLGQKSLKRIIPFFGGMGEANRKVNSERQKAFTANYEAAMNNSSIGKLDAVLSPVCALPGFLHNTADKVGLGGIYTGLYNLTGFPAGVATISKVKQEEAVGRKTTADLSIKTASKIEASSTGLPLAVQIAARHWDEHIVIALINQLHRNVHVV
jgi:fatty acid amide hydrolase